MHSIKLVFGLLVAESAGSSLANPAPRFPSLSGVDGPTAPGPAHIGPGTLARRAAMPAPGNLFGKVSKPSDAVSTSAGRGTFEGLPANTVMDYPVGEPREAPPKKIINPIMTGPIPRSFLKGPIAGPHATVQEGPIGPRPHMDTSSLLSVRAF